MRLLILLLCVITITQSCTKSGTSSTPEGIYYGKYQLQSTVPRGNSPSVSNIVLKFSANTWSGRSSISYLPRIDHGTFRFLGTASIMIDSQVFYADNLGFVLFEGAYALRAVGDSLSMTRTNADGSVEQYRLRRL